MIDRLVPYRYAFIGAAVVMDIAIVLGPSLATASTHLFVFLMARWLILQLGGLVLVKAYRLEKIDLRVRNRLSAYLIWGFTAAAVLNFAVHQWSASA